MDIYLIKLLVLITFLLFLSYEDIKSKTVPNKILLIMLIVGVALSILQLQLNLFLTRVDSIDAVFTSIELQINLFLSSFVIGFTTLIIMSLLSWLSKGNIGMGDVKLLGVIGFYIGNIYILSIIFYSMLLIFIFSIIMLLLRKANLKTQFPFVPFITGGVIIYLINLL